MKLYKCEICQNSKISIFFSYWRHPLLVCKKCGLEFAASMPKISQLQDLHNNKYWNDMYAELGVNENPNAWQEWKQWKQSLFNSLGVDISVAKKGEKRVLDIGCGNGALLELFLEKGWECVGVDFSDFLVKKSFPAGIKIFNSSFETIDFKEKNFDFICLVHTLEHLRHPVKCLLKAKRYLKDKGLLFIELPLTQNYFAIHHQYFFSNKSIYIMLLNAGLEVVAETTYQDKIHMEKQLFNTVIVCREIELNAQ